MEIDVINIIVQTIIAVIIVTPMGTIHELIHVWKAKKLGYEVTKIDLRRNATHVKIEADDPNHKRIAAAPYYFMFPIGIIISIIGYITGIIGILVGGITILFLHSLSFWLEGEDPDENVSESKSNTPL